MKRNVTDAYGWTRVGYEEYKYFTRKNPETGKRERHCNYTYRYKYGYDNTFAICRPTLIECRKERDRWVVNKLIKSQAN